MRIAANAADALAVLAARIKASAEDDEANLDENGDFIGDTTSGAYDAKAERRRDTATGADHTESDADWFAAHAS
jgi:hypothetical protein